MKRTLSRLFFLVFIPTVGILIATYFYYTGGRYVVTENAYVKAHLINISSDIDGRVVEVNVENNQPVVQGELLFRVDPEPAEIELTAAQAEVENVGQRIDSLKSRHKRTLLDIDDAEERIKFLASLLKRQEKLKQQGHGLEIDFEKAEHNLEMGRRALNTAHQQSTVVLTELAGDPNIPLEKHPLFLSAQAKVDRALRSLNSTQITAPADGVLSNVNLEAGEYLEAGDLVFSIVETGRLWVEANLKESQLTHLQIGQEATIVADAFPDNELKAIVVSMSPATGSEFSVLPAQNSTGNWVKVVQRIPVKLEIQDQKNGPQLRAGMTTEVRIDTKHQREAPAIIRSVIASMSSLNE
jgi:membrane fusion protein (multidrug efflux system)